MRYDEPNYNQGPEIPPLSGLAATEQRAYPSSSTEADQPYRMRDISITQLNHGYIISVGCQRFAIETKANLIDKLSLYITNPLQTEIDHQNGKLFSSQ